MVAPGVLVILDGASEPLVDARPTSLERARTPALDALACAGMLARVRTVPAGLAPGSEVAIPVLLGWTPTAPVDRGAIEAAAYGVHVPAGSRAWRVDVLAGIDPSTRADRAMTRRAALALRVSAPAHAVHRLTGHRLLLVGPAPLPDGARAPYLRVWPEGAAVPRTLDASTVVIAARGAAAGLATLLGADVVVPRGVTGDPDTDLGAKARAVIVALSAGAADVVVHVGGADEAAHRRDEGAKVAFLERADRDLIAPLADAVARAGGTLRVCPDHGCDPATGAHDAHPVPCVTRAAYGAGAWAAGDAGARPADRPPRRLTERAVANLHVSVLAPAAAAVPA